jgi:hypothetical protein
MWVTVKAAEFGRWTTRMHVVTAPQQQQHEQQRMIALIMTSLSLRAGD